MGPLIKDYKLHLCGMFSFSANQRKKITAQAFYKPYQAAPEVASIISKQYYPAFRHIITNTAPGSTHIELIGSSLVPFSDCSFINYQNSGNSATSPTFCIQNVSLTFYDDHFGIGIYSFELQCFDPVEGPIAISFDDLTSFTLFAREFGNIIKIGSETMTMAEFIEKKLLKLDDNGNTIKITENSGSSFYSGSKMKTWTTVDIPGLQAEEYTQLLYELGTCGKYGTALSGDLFSSSQSYFLEKTADAISVYNNWSALCLWDSFSMIGNGYKGNSYSVWSESYFKIYKFNLYCKFYLFKINSDLATSGKLGITRNELVNFITKYDLEVISYNFLPNLLFQRIKTALGIKAESEALLAKIQSRNNLLQEQSALFLNWFLGIIAFLSLVSIVGDASGLYDKLYGVVCPNQQIVKLNTWLTLGFLCFTIVLVLIIYQIKRHSQIKHK
jgi:hypothetical protein